MSRKNLKRSLALSALMAFVITGSAMAADYNAQQVLTGESTSFDGKSFTCESVFGVNGVTNYGGAIEAKVDLALKGCQFENNSLTRAGEARGGAIYVWSGNDLQVENSKFLNNTVENTSGRPGTGGAIHFGENTNSNIKDSLFQGNVAIDAGDRSDMGGAIYFSSGNHTVENCEFNGNSGAEGGAFVTNHGVVTVIDSDFINNEAPTQNGGAINIQGSDGKVILKGENNFAGNSAKESGGAIKVYSGNILEINGTATFTDNTANGVANDISNDGIVSIKKDAVVTLDGGMNGSGAVNLAGTLNGKITDNKVAFSNGGTWNVKGESEVALITGNDFVITGAQGAARSAEGNSLTIVNTKDNSDVESNGIYSTGNDTISNLKNLDVTANRHAIEVATGMEIEAEGVKLTSNKGNGILAYGDLTIQANDMGILAKEGHGIRAAEDDGHAANVNIDVERLTVVAENRDETSIKVSNGAEVSANASDTANINGQVLAELDSTVKLSGGTVNVTSVEDALDAVGGTIDVDAKNVNLVSQDSDGIQAYDANIYVNGDNVTVQGNSFGIKSVAENTSSVEVTGGNITIIGTEGAIGAYESAVDNAGNDTYTGVPVVSVNATGKVDIKGEVYGEHNSEISLKGATVNVASGDKDALDSCGGTISVDATDINITSKENDAIQANDANVTLKGTNVTIESGQLVNDQWVGGNWAIKNVDETNSIVKIEATNNVTIRGGEEGAIWSYEGGKGEVIVEGRGTTTIDGDILAQSKGKVSVLLNNAESSLTGAVTTDNGTTTLTMNDGATWNVTGTSNVSVVAGNEGNVVVDKIQKDYVKIDDNKNENLNVTYANGDKVATKDNLLDLQETVNVKGNEVSTVTFTDAAIAGDVTMDAESEKTTTTLDTTLNVTGDVVAGDVVAGDVSLQETAANLDAEVANRQAEVGRLDNRIDKVDAKIDKVGAMAAAMASLKTMGYDPEAPTEIAVGVGQYRGETGLAIGAFHYPNKNFMLNFSLSTAGDEVMGGIGATWKIGRKR